MIEFGIGLLVVASCICSIILIVFGTMRFMDSVDQWLEARRRERRVKEREARKQRVRAKQVVLPSSHVVQKALEHANSCDSTTLPIG